MREFCYDYSDQENNGCCLNCENSEIGCLCFECKCKECYWYNYDGYCEKVEVLKVERKKKYIGDMRERDKIKSENYKKMIEIYNNINEELSKKGVKPYLYSCQKCQVLIISEFELDCLSFKYPLCLFCRDCL